MQICGLQKLTVIDYPGRVAATVFLCGCNLRCPWCYSRELVLPEENAFEASVVEGLEVYPIDRLKQAVEKGIGRWLPL